MASEQEPDGPSLEPPSLFRRKKKPAAAEPVVEPPVVEPPVDDSPTTILDDVGPVSQPPAPQPTAPPLFADEAPTQPVAAAVPARPAASSDPIGSSASPDRNPIGSLDAPQRAPKPPRTPRQGLLVSGRVAAAITGVLVGALIVGLTSASFELCSRIQGTNSCGGPGIFLLVAILALAVLLGTAVLRLLRVPEPGSTSFLAVGLTSVVALLFLVDQIFEWWMVIAIPLVSVATFLLSQWVTATFVEPEPEVGRAQEPEVVDHDVR